MTRTDWEINIENTAASVAAKYSNEVAASVFDLLRGSQPRLLRRGLR